MRTIQMFISIIVTGLMISCGSPLPKYDPLSKYENAGYTVQKITLNDNINVSRVYAWPQSDMLFVNGSDNTVSIIDPSINAYKYKNLDLGFAGVYEKTIYVSPQADRVMCRDINDTIRKYNLRPLHRATYPI